MEKMRGLPWKPNPKKSERTILPASVTVEVDEALDLRLASSAAAGTERRAKAGAQYSASSGGRRTGRSGPGPV